MKSIAAIAVKAGEKLIIDEVDVDGPQSGRSSRGNQSYGRMPHGRIYAVGR